MTCELSGESLAASQETVVVTPSGHVCLKRLLLTKLSENGGMDPFTVNADRPLSEDALIELAKPKSVVPPRPNAATSYGNLLELLQAEYDAVVLELFDTRQALQSTRQELSQSLYQNDAAVRVIARLARERDEARQQLASLQGGGGAPTRSGAAPAGTGPESETQSQKRGIPQEQEGDAVAEQPLAFVTRTV